MAWPSFTADVTQNSNQITIHGAVPASEIPAGFEAIVYGAQAIANLEVASGTDIMYDGENNPYSYLYLVRPFTGVSAAGVEVVIKPTGSLFNDVVGVFRTGSNQQNQLMANYYQFCEGDTPITHQPLDENADPLTIDTLPMMNQQVADAISAFQNAAGTAAGYDVTESATDTSDGSNGSPKLLKVGDGGLLSQVIQYAIADFNDETKFIPKYHGSAGANRPENIGVLLPMIRQGYGMQIDHCASGDTYTRGVNNHNYGPWRKILHTGNTGSIVTEDYEEGAWTPSFNYGTHDIISSTGFYKKVGNLVYVEGNVLFNVFDNTPNAEFGVAGLPFVSASDLQANPFSFGHAYGTQGLADNSYFPTFCSVEGVVLYPRKAQDSNSSYSFNSFSRVRGSFTFSTTYRVG